MQTCSKWCMAVVLIAAITNGVLILLFMSRNTYDTKFLKPDISPSASPVLSKFNNSTYDAPGKYFDLSEWHVQVPEQPINHQSDELIDGYSSQYFYYNESDKSMVFMCPNVGALTTTSRLIRTELANDNLFEITNTGYYYQNATMMLCNTSKYVVANQSNTRYSTVIQQIHGTSRALPLVVIQWYSDTNEMLVLYKLNNETVDNATFSKNKAISMGTMATDVKFTATIIVDNGMLSVYLNSKRYLNIDATEYWSFKNYFKIGNYFHHPGKINMHDFPDWKTEIKIFKLQTKHIYPTRDTTPFYQFPFYIFQTGFNKCGTSSLFDFFRANEIPSIHFHLYFDPNNANKVNTIDISLWELMTTKYAMNEPVLGDLIARYRFYSDYGTIVRNVSWFKILNVQYPNSKYILSIRNINHWLKSKYTHQASDGSFRIDNYHMYDYMNNNNNNHINRIQQEKDILMQWKKGWYDYHCDILQYFKSHNISHNLLIYDIEYDSSDKITEFFQSFNLTLNGTVYHRKGTTMNKAQKSIQITRQLQKWNKSHSVTFQTDDDFINEYQRIIHMCNKDKV